jgi:hypothetical protein
MSGSAAGGARGRADGHVGGRRRCPAAHLDLGGVLASGEGVDGGVEVHAAPTTCPAVVGAEPGEETVEGAGRLRGQGGLVARSGGVGLQAEELAHEGVATLEGGVVGVELIHEAFHVRRPHTLGLAALDDLEDLGRVRPDVVEVVDDGLEVLGLGAGREPIAVGRGSGGLHLGDDRHAGGLGLVAGGGAAEGDDSHEPHGIGVGGGLLLGGKLGEEPLRLGPLLVDLKVHLTEAELVGKVLRSHLHTGREEGTRAGFEVGSDPGSLGEVLDGHGAGEGGEHGGVAPGGQPVSLEF